MADLDVLVSSTVAVFAELPFDLLDEDWVQLAWNSKYTDVTPPDISFDDGNSFALLDQIAGVCDVCQEWYRLSAFDEGGDGNDSDKLWKTLMENSLHCKTLLGLIYGGISQGNTATASISRKIIAIRFVKLYFNLLLVPGSTAYRIFQESLFQCAVQCFRLPVKRVTVIGNDTIGRGASQSSRKQTSRKKQSTQQDDPDFLPEPPGIPEADDISEQALGDYMTLMTDALKDLVWMLQPFSLQPYLELTEFLIQQLCELTQVEIPGSHVTLNLNLDQIKIRSSHYRHLPTYAYAALKLLCLPLHGDPPDNFRSIAKHLMPHILMHTAGNVSTVSRPFSNVRDHAVAFVTNILDESGDDSRETLEEVVHVLIHNLALQAVDKTDFRAKTSQAIMTLMGKLSDARFESLVSWFEKLMLSPHSSKRVFALEMMSVLIWAKKIGDRREALLLGVMRRCNDKVSTVKTKALAVLAAVTGESQGEWMPLLRVDPTLQPLRERGSLQDEASTDSGTQLVSVQEDRSSQMMQMLVQRLDDPKVHVRRTALAVLENVLCAGGEFLKEEYVKLLQEKCVDPAVLVRKQALQCLTRCLQAHSHCNWLHHLWLEGALPAVFDPEASVQEKVVELVESALLAPLCVPDSGIYPDLSWNLLGLLMDDRFPDYHKYLQKAISILARVGKIRHGMLRWLKPHIYGPNDAAAWLLLSKLALFSDLGEAEFALEYWRKVCPYAEHPASSDTQHCVLLVIRKTAHHLPLPLLESLVDDFEKQLERMTISVEVTPKAVDCLCALLHLQHGDREEKAKKAIASWGKMTLDRCCAYLSPLLLERATKLEECSEDELISHLVLLGEAAMAAPKAVTNRMHVLVQSCVSAPAVDAIRTTQEEDSSPQRKKTRRNHRQDLRVTYRIRAHAFVVLGKMAIQNEEFAKKTVAAIAKELERSDNLCIRNNVIVILSDLCKRYAILVDPYLPCVTACLKDREAELRHLTLETLFQLLKQDFIKLKGSLFYRLLTTLVDECKPIRELSSYGLGCQVYTRHPHVFYQRFIETMYHFNDFQRNAVTQVAGSNDKEDPFSLSGERNAKLRMTVYKFLLEHMNDEERFKLNLSITQNILAPCTDKGDTLIAQCPLLLKDALAVLCCEEIKLQSIIGQEEAAEDDVSQAILLAAKKSILSNVVKQNVVENIVPVVIALKHRLESERSPLLRFLLLFLRELMRDYKNEVKEMLALDKNTASEVAFDLKKLEEEEGEGGVKPPAGKQTQDGGGKMSTAQQPEQEPAKESRAGPNREVLPLGGCQAEEAMPDDESHDTEGGNSSPYTSACGTDEDLDRGTKQNRSSDTREIPSVPLEHETEEESPEEGTGSEASITSSDSTSDTADFTSPTATKVSRCFRSPKRKFPEEVCDALGEKSIRTAEEAVTEGKFKVPGQRRHQRRKKATSDTVEPHTSTPVSTHRVRYPFPSNKSPIR